MTSDRKPAFFRLTSDPATPTPAPTPTPARAPRAVPAAELPTVERAEVDLFDPPDATTAPPPPARPLHGRAGWGTVLVSALGGLATLGIGLWTDRLIRDLFARADWLGYLAAGVASVAAIALLVILAREAMALARLSSVAALQRRGEEALARNDAAEARRLVADLSLFVAGRPQTAAGRRALDDLRGEVIDGADLVRLAETELLAPLDAEAQTAILNAAKRVSIVTAVSPRALVDVAYVLFESGRLIRRLSELYGGCPGTLGFFRLARNVLAHLAVTGSMAAGDSLVQQLVGHGLAARISARLGEGVVNGMMTARIGIAAMETTRPLPFAALKRPGLSDFLGQLTAFATARGAARRQEKD